ncbi:zinc finger protein 37-like [Nilaparvata lugens]|uniref:zinc finger protein 37-like n=1 Tax=Nilaparvata lugens TaxID=108931 RepID=UPI00193E6F3B|nr:zinc finger protein 37-like [Nilaparvata lugens]
MNDDDIDVSASPVKEFARLTKCKQLKSDEKLRSKQPGSNENSGKEKLSAKYKSKPSTENSGKEKLTKVDEKTYQDGEEDVYSEEEFDDEDHDIDYVFDSAEDSEGDGDHKKDESTSSTPKKQKSEKSEPTFKCQLCKKDLTRLQIIEGHECSKFVCKTCGKQFAHKSHLRRHVITHSREKPYKCGLCDKAYFRADMLVDHCRTHPGYKPHQCAICKKCFTIKKLLHEHLKDDHSKVRNLGEYCVNTNSMSPGDTGKSNCSNPRKNVDNEEEERTEEREKIEEKVR